MPVFYADINKRNFFSAPQFNRMRHRYRGPRESSKINLEVDQISFSLHKLYETYNAIFGDFRTYANLLLEGGDTEVDSLSGDLVLDGLEELTARVVALDKRVKALEA